MTTVPTVLSRRVLIGTALAAAVPSVARGQQTRSNDLPVRTLPTRLGVSFDGHAFTVVLHDNPTARDLVSLLPLDLTIKDYSTNEKIAVLPRKLTEEGAGPFSGEAPGDLGYYAPWGNLAFYHGDYTWSAGLIRLGRLEGGVEPLLHRGTYPLRLEAVP